MVAPSRGSSLTAAMEARYRRMSEQIRYLERMAEELAGALRLAYREAGHEPDGCIGCKALSLWDDLG